MATKLGVYNMACRSLGAKTLSSLTDDVKQRRALDDVYDYIRDEVLKIHPWNFAIKRSDLTEITATDPEYEWDTWYTLPSDCLRVLDIEDGADFVVEGGVLLTNESTAEIKYIAQITDESEFSVEFAIALAARLAAEISYDVTGNANMYELKMKEYMTKLKYARSIDGQEGTVQKTEDTPWIDDRA